MSRRLLPFVTLLAASCTTDVTPGGAGKSDRDADASLVPPTADASPAVADASAVLSDTKSDPKSDAEPRPPGMMDASLPVDSAPPIEPRDAEVDAGRDGAPGRVLVAPPGYPAGPWGNDVGDVIAPLVWTGRVNESAATLATDQPVATYSMDDLRTSGRPYALVHLSEWFCPGCRNAATDLGVLGPSVVDAGGLVVEILGTHGFFSPASVSDVDAWITTYDLEVTTVTDAEGYELATFEAFGVRETALIVDLSSMRIVWKMNGDLGGDLPSSINAATTEILSLLAN